jgi:hypothetical protein
MLDRIRVNLNHGRYRTNREEREFPLLLPNGRIP